MAEALTAVGDPGALTIAYPREIRAISLRIFDRSFAVTYLLEAVAVLIGLAGVAASFAALAAGVGVLGGLLAGGAIGLVLIEVVNRQSFHWGMDLHVPWGSLALFASGLIALAALAAVLAGRQAMRQDAVLAVREGW